MTETMTDNNMMQKKEFPTTHLARFSSPEPRLRDIADPAPIPIVWAIATINIWRGKAIANAPIANGPTPLPTKIVSTILYKALATIPTTAGKDNRNKSLSIFS